MDKGKELASFRIPRYKILLAMIQFVGEDGRIHM